MKNVHLIGIGGSGLSAIARFLLESGYGVSGSDRQISNLAADLERAGARIFTGHAAANIAGADLVVRSSAIPDDNPEILAAQAAGIPVLKRSEFLGQLMQNHTGIAVAGTHGKTTTTAMIAWILSALGQDPSYIIGGVSKNLGSNAHAGKGATFVIEADEYDRMFLGLKPNVIVITTMEHDHPDCYPTPAEYRQAFVDFLHGLRPQGTLLLCADDPGAAGLAADAPAGCKSLFYGLHSTPGYQASQITNVPGAGFAFQANFTPANGPQLPLAQVDLLVPGEHNMQNALAALATAHCLSLPLEEAAAALGAYTGTGRRFDVLGQAQGVVVIDDYAHHPTEIRTTLAAARSRYPGQRIWAVWQPHTYSRTQALRSEFMQAFSTADQVVVTEIYASREKQQVYSSAQLVEQMDPAKTIFMPTLPAASAYLLDQLRPSDVLLVLSAGDADQVSACVLAKLKEREHAKA